MSNYGLECYSQEGNPFLLVDKKPFTFHHKWELNGATETILWLNTGISASVDALFFGHIQMHSNNDHPRGYAGLYSRNTSGVWEVGYGCSSRWGATTYTILAFTSRAIKDVSGGVGYGIQVFDEGGNIVYGNESQPAKFHILPGPPIAADGFVGVGGLPGRYAILASGWACRNHRGGDFVASCLSASHPNGTNTVSGFLSGIHTGTMFPAESWTYYNNTSLIGVDISAYVNK